MELNSEQIKKALECCIVNDWNSTKCNECPIYNGGGGCIDELKEATIALINSKEQKIFELENRLKECENGYEGTLFLDRCKLHDAEEKVKQLTEEVDKLGKALETMSADHERSIRLTEAYTVLKMHSMLCEGRVSNDTVVIVANQIANEMLEEIRDEKSE